MPNELTVEQPGTPSPAEQAEFDKAWDMEDWGSDDEKQETPLASLEEGSDTLSSEEDAEDEVEEKEEDSAEDAADEGEEESTEEEDGLSALERLARDKFYPDKKEDDKKEEVVEGEETEEKFTLTKDKDATKSLPTKTVSDPIALAREVVDSFEGEIKEDAQRLLEDYPEIAQLVAGMAQKLTASQTQAKPPAEMEEKLTTLETQNKELMEYVKSRQEKDALADYFDAMEVEVPDARRVVRGKEFQEWLVKQSVGIQRLADSGDPADGTAIVQEFKRQTASRKAKIKDEEDGQKAETRKVGLRSLSGSKTSAAPRKQAADIDDFDAGWDLPPPEGY